LAELQRMCEETPSTNAAQWQPRLREILASTSPSARVALIGVGHPMRGDDFVGSFIIKTLLKDVRTDKVILFDAEDGVEWMISKIGKLNLRHLIIIDACEMNMTPGQVALIPLGETDYPFFTTHGIPLKLLTSKLLPNVESSILAIQPGRMGLNEKLSPAVSIAARSILNLVATTLRESEFNV